MSGPANPPANSFGDLSQTIPAAPYLSQSLLFRVAVRVEGTAKAVLWLRVNRHDGTVSFIVNSPDITANQWQYYQASGPVAADSDQITFGLLNFGSGDVRVDDASLHSLQDFAAEGSRPLSETGLANLTAFAKVLRVRAALPPQRSGGADRLGRVQRARSAGD